MKVESQLKLQGAPENELVFLIIDSIRDIKGKEIVALDLRHVDDAPTDYFIICEGESFTQVKAISENICKRVKEEKGLQPNHVEGERHSKWILVDYFDTVVHIFYPEVREYYQIEDLWGDAESTHYES